MIDIVRIFEKYADDKGMLFDYGTKATLNLLGGTSNIPIELDKIYFLLERRKFKPKANEYGKVTGYNYTGHFFLVVNSDFDLINFADATGGKYENNIEPLLQCCTEFYENYSCTDLEIDSFEAQDVTDVLDQNMDGLLINFSIFIPHDYSL